MEFWRGENLEMVDLEDVEALLDDVELDQPTDARLGLGNGQ